MKMSGWPIPAGSGAQGRYYREEYIYPGLA